LPATTAQGHCGSSIDPGGTAIVVERDRLVDQRSEHVQHGCDRDGARRVEIVVLLRRGSGEVDQRVAPLAIDGDAHLDPLAVVELVTERAVAQAADRAPRAALGVVLHFAHVGGEALVAELGGRALELADAAGVRRELGAEIR
jgi:hypothetical protein